MPRRARVVVPFAPHHVYLRGNNRRRLFSNAADRLFMLRCLEAAVRKTECALHQLTLMTNHVHLIARPPDAGALADLIQRACQRYAQVRNAQRDASGKLFEERFKSKVISDDKQLMITTLYNDANAFRAHLGCEPAEHSWSTGPLHAGLAGSEIPRRMWTPSPWYLGLASTPDERARLYRQLIAAYCASSGEPLVHEVAEPADIARYRRRIERPDGTRAREGWTQWPLKLE